MEIDFAARHKLASLTDDAEWVLVGLRTVPRLGLRFKPGAEFWWEVGTLIHHGWVTAGGPPELTERGELVADFKLGRLEIAK